MNQQREPEESTKVNKVVVTRAREQSLGQRQEDQGRKQRG